MEDNIKKAIEVFKQGGIVIFPTDTVWGIGCILNNEESVKKLFAIRKRPESKAVIALVASIAMAQDYLLPIEPGVQKNIFEKYVGVTVILPCRTEKVPKIVRGGGNTLAVRIPSHPLLLPIVTDVGIPILAPSANFAGEKTPATFEEIDKKLLSQVDYILPGKSLGNKPSTIVDCSLVPWKIVRQGDVYINL